MKQLKMKQTRTLLALTILIITIVSCNKENLTEPVKGTVEFTFNLQSQTKSINLDNSPASIVVSVDDAFGQSVYKNKQVNFTQTNGSYTTEPLPFEPGSYKLTKFMVVDTEGNVLHATPMGFSSVATLVDNPLPVAFTVQKGIVTRLIPEIIPTQSKLPEDFGYTSFKLNEQESFNFRLGVYIFNSDSKQFETTTALLSLVSDAGESFEHITAGLIDTIKVREAGKYILNVSKEGYQSWSDTLSEDDLLHYYNNAMAVALDKNEDPSFGFTTVQDTLTRLVINIKSTDNSTPLRVNWGDGKMEVITAPDKLIHDYLFTGKYNVKFTGNISSIYKLVVTHCQISAISLEKMDQLASIEISRNQKLKTLNLSEKPNLKEVYCVEGSIESLNLTNSNSVELIYCSLNNLKNLDISTLPNLKTVYCDRNKMTTLETKNNTNLKVLYCYQNSLTSLDIANNTALETLDCRNNKLAFVDISKLLTLKNVLLGDNNINNDNANKILVDLLQTVKTNQRIGQISLNVSVKDAGETAKSTLEKTYSWKVNTM